MDACDRCVKTMKEGELHVQCMGFCSRTVHAKCANMNSSFLKVLAERQNLFWMCDECAKLMKLARFRTTVSSMGSVISAINKGRVSSLLWKNREKRGIRREFKTSWENTGNFHRSKIKFQEISFLVCCSCHISENLIL